MSGDDTLREVPRPSLPPLAWGAVAMAAGVWAAEYLVWRAGGEAPTRAGLAVAVASVIALVAWSRRLRVAVLCGLALAAGLVAGTLFWMHVAEMTRVATGSAGSRWQVAVVSDASEGLYGATSDVVVELGGGRAIASKASWPKGVSPPEAGTRVVAYGSFVAQTDAGRAEQEFEQGSAGSLRVRRIDSVAWDSGLSGLEGRVRSWAVARLARIPGPGGALLGGSMLGDKRRLSSTPTDTDMKIAGLAHFEATSGYHLLLIGGVLEWLLLGAGLGRRSRGVLVLGVTALFVALCGGRVSVVRAWVMAAVARGGWQSGRRADAVSALALCVAVMLAATPSTLFDLAFQLSVLAVSAILIFGRLAEGWTAVTLPVRLRGAAGPIAVTVCAVVASMPLSAPAFGFVSPIAPVSNLFAAPLVAASVLLGLVGLAASVVWTALGATALSVAGAFAAMLASLASAFARVPYAAVPAASSWMTSAAGLGAAVALWAWWPQPRRRAGRVLASLALAGVLVALVPLPSPGGPQITVLDVGQGDAILVSDAGHDMLVDTGPSGAVLLGALARHHVTRLDEVVITHLHADHYGGLAAAESVLHVPLVFVPEGTLSGTYAVVDTARRSAGGGSVRELGAGDALQVGSVQLDVVSPREPVINAATNEASVVMIASHGGKRVLLTGDAEQQIVQAAVDAGALGRVDVLKVGHHGSAISVDERLLGELEPHAAIISVGAGNRYGHPTPTALRVLRGAGVPTYRTDLDGDVTISLGVGAADVRGSRHRESYVAVGPSRRRRLQFGGVPVPCATLNYAGDPISTTAETHVSNALRSQARLPHLRDRGPPPAAGVGEAEEACG